MTDNAESVAPRHRATVNGKKLRVISLGPNKGPLSGAIAAERLGQWVAEEAQHNDGDGV